jgi:tRNA pseudouridine55 synthase
MENDKSGFILMDKQKGWTSFDVVAKLRGITGIRKIGHAGTLDPIATGLLIVAIGRDATKQIDKYMKMDKVYIAKAKFGETSDTYDAEGIIQIQEIDNKTEIELQGVLKNYVGETKQVPPMFSAKKVQGKKLYELARQGKEIEREPVEIHISKIDLLSFDYPWFEMKVHCGSGTYIRSLIHDVGQELKVGAVMYELRRTKIGNFDIKKAALLEQLNKENWEEFLFNK